MLAATSLVRLWLERLVAVQVADRAVALAALAFTVLIPLFIVFLSWFVAAGFALVPSAAAGAVWTERHEKRQKGD
jgi:hypothetical protein